MAKSKHTHKYIKVSGKHVKIFKCAFPDCVFVLNPGQFEMLIGRFSYCNSCDEKFIMTENSLNEDKPICDECKLKKTLKSIGVSDSIIEEVGIEDLDGYLSIKGV